MNAILSDVQVIDMINELMWRITYRCNKQCQYCFNEVFSDKVNHLCEERLDIDYIVFFIKKLGITKVYISGGEPAVVDGLDDIAKKIALHSKVILFTNGLLFDRYDINTIGAMPIDAINTTIDIKDILEKTLNFQSLMSEFNGLRTINPLLKLNVQLMIDDSYFNVVGSEGYKILCSCVNRVLWQPLTVPINNSLYIHTLEGMNEDQAKTIVDNLKMNSQGEMLDHICNLESVLNDLGPKKCQMGQKYITMNPDMSLSLCPHINDYFITEDELMSIVDNAKPFLCDRFSMRCFSLYSHLLRRYPMH